jgi:hypothetical protein
MKRHLDENKLFGDSRLLVAADATELATSLTMLLQDDTDRARRGAIGRDRIGGPGAIDRIIETLV